MFAVCLLCCLFGFMRVCYVYFVLGGLLVCFVVYVTCRFVDVLYVFGVFLLLFCLLFVMLVVSCVFSFDCF